MGSPGCLGCLGVIGPQFRRRMQLRGLARPPPPRGTDGVGAVVTPNEIVVVVLLGN